MRSNKVGWLGAVLLALAALASACSSSKGTDAGSASTSSSGSANAAASFVALGGWEGTACDATQPEVVVGTSQPMDVAGVSLKDYVDGTQAAVAAFNKRGGIRGRCINLKVCDGKADGPTEVACARGETEDASMVAGLASTFITDEADAYQLFESAGLPQIGAQAALPGGWNSPLAYDFSMGPSGTLFADIAALKSVGVTKFSVFIPVSGQAGAFSAFVAPLVKALGMQQLDVIQIPPTAVEFTQFVIAAQNAGAEGVVLGLPPSVGSQIIDAMDTLNSPLKIGGSWGTFSQSTVEGLPPAIAANTAYTDALPPVATDTSRWPIYDVVLDDFKAAGKANLERSSVTTQALDGWLAVYTLVKVMRDSAATDITRATVKQAFDEAKDVPMFDLEPPWTPSKESTNPIFKGISNAAYWTGHWDPDNQQFVVDDKQVDILALLG